MAGSDSQHADAIRASIADKEAKILRLQTRLAAMKETVQALENARATADEAHAAEVSALRERADAAEAAKKRAMQQCERADLQIEEMEQQQQAQAAQHRHLLEDAQAAGWKDGDLDIAGLGCE